jgi:hypothetical protein
MGAGLEIIRGFIMNTLVQKRDKGGESKKEQKNKQHIDRGRNPDIDREIAQRKSQGDETATQVMMNQDHGSSDRIKKNPDGSIEISYDNPEVRSKTHRK